ncbi:MAG: hypothetical protein AAGI71_17540 [Bacteroidota bacterium]
MLRVREEAPPWQPAVVLECTEDPAEPDRLRESDGVGRLPTIGFSLEF